MPQHFRVGLAAHEFYLLSRRLIKYQQHRDKADGRDQTRDGRVYLSNWQRHQCAGDVHIKHRHVHEYAQSVRTADYPAIAADNGDEYRHGGHGGECQSKKQPVVCRGGYACLDKKAALRGQRGHKRHIAGKIYNTERQQKCVYYHLKRYECENEKQKEADWRNEYQLYQLFAVLSAHSGVSIALGFGQVF